MGQRLGPRARRVYDALHGRIVRGELSVGERLPNRLALAGEFGVAPMTVNGALARLEEEGLLSIQHGRGTFVLGSPSWPTSPEDAAEAWRMSVAALRDRDEALRLSEARLRTIFHNAPIGINVTDVDGRYVQVNDTLCVMLGYTEAELLTRAFTEITHPDDALLDWALFEELRAGKREKYQIDKRYLRKDGVPVWVRITTCFLSDPTGGPLFNVGMVEDITAQRHTAEALRQSEESFRLLFAHNPQPMWVYDRETLCFLEVNEAAVNHYGYSRAEFLGLRLTDIRPETDLPQLRNALETRHSLGQFGGAFTHRLRDGRRIDVEVQSHPLPFGERPAVLVLATDVTERRRAELALRESEARYRAITENASDAIIAIDETSTMRAVNPAAVRMFGYATAEMIGRPLTMLMPEHLRRDHVIGFGRYLQSGERRLSWNGIDLIALHHDGHEFPIEVSFTEMQVGNERVFTGFIRDTTARRQAEQQLEHQATHDSLTGLPNRALLQERLQYLIKGATVTTPAALLLMDLDGFKAINDTLGHHHGDLLLQQVAARLRETVRSADTVSRLGGDEFAVLLPATDAAGVQRTAEKIEAALAGAYTIEGRTVHTGTSIGIAICPEHGTDGSLLLRRADAAMYMAKRGRLAPTLYSPEGGRDFTFRQVLTEELRLAIGGDGLVLYYQPKVHCSTGTVQAVEALVRWRHPQRGLIPPNQFIPIAEETGLIGPLTIWVLKNALSQCAAWRREGQEIGVAVNLSARNLHDRRLPEQIDGMIRSLALPPSALTVEISEHTLINDRDAAGAILARLHDIGVRVAIDNFGSGYASLAYLDRLPIDELKLDRTFVESMRREQFVSPHSMIDLGRRLGFEVIAEGIEDEAMLRAVGQLGCTAAQGFRLCHPLPAAKVLPWLTTAAAEARAVAESSASTSGT